MITNRMISGGMERNSLSSRGTIEEKIEMNRENLNMFVMKRRIIIEMKREIIIETRRRIIIEMKRRIINIIERRREIFSIERRREIISTIRRKREKRGEMRKVKLSWLGK